MLIPSRVTVGMRALRATWTKVTRRGSQTLGPGGGDEVGSENLEHADAQAPDEHRDDGEGGAQPGQHERVHVLPERRPVSADGKPVQVHREGDYQDDAEPERGHPEPHQRDHTDGVVARALFVCGGKSRQGHGDDDGEQGGDADEGGGEGKTGAMTDTTGVR